MATKRPKPEIGVEVYALGDSKKRGTISAVSDHHGFVTVTWSDGTESEAHIYRLGDVEAKRRAAKNAMERWSHE